jgi:arginyl-tRNA synthetase
MVSLKSQVAEFLKKCGQEIYIPFLEYPSDATMGDVALPCFQLAKELRKSPQQIASELAIELSVQAYIYIDRVEGVGPYVNFFLNWSTLSHDLFQQIQQGEFGM